MVYEVPKAKASLKQNRFEFRMPGKTKVYSVPKLEFLKPSLALKLDGDITGAAAARLLFAEYLPEALDQFEDGPQLQEFMTAWAEASGVSLGESGASPES